MSSLPRLLAGMPASGTAGLGDHLATHGPLPSARDLDAAGLLDLVERSGLRGRGGAGFPMGVKLHAVARGPGDAVVVANGTEGEPASAKDRLLMAASPHLVLDGIGLAAEAVGARDAIVAVGEDDAESLGALRHATAERRDSGAGGATVRVATIPPGYLAGQETALIAALDGGPALPTATPPRPSERGLARRPTLVQNVETLAHLALLARHGEAWFRELGSEAEPGSALVTLSGEVGAPGVYEIELGTTLEEVVTDAGGNLRRSRAALVGGYFGAWLAPGTAHALPLDEHHLRQRGAMLGAGVIAVLPAAACPVAETVRVTRWLVDQRAGQCGPCDHGLPAIAGALEQLAAGRTYPGIQADLARWCGLVRHRGACRHPDGTATFVASALTEFAGEFADHAERGPCDACAAPPVLPTPRHLAAAAA